MPLYLYHYYSEMGLDKIIFTPKISNDKKSPILSE
jgi:hypothetical protein